MANKRRERISGARRFFEGVVIRAETYQPVESPQPAQGAAAGSEFNQGSTAGTVYKGGNRLLIAAQPSDWEQLRKLVDKLDVPQLQVILEVLIVDYERDLDKRLNSQVRNLSRFDFLPGAGFQAAHITSNILTSAECMAAAASGASQLLTGDILQKAANDFASAAGSLGNAVKAGASTQAQALSQATQATNSLKDSLAGASKAAQNLAQAACPADTTITGDLLRFFTDTTGTIIPAAPGTAAVSFNDPAGTGIWGLLSILDNIGHAKVLSHPHLIALNNTNAQVYSSLIRRTQTDGSSSTGGAIQVNIGDIPATLSLSLTPRISSVDRLNLEVVVDVTQFTSDVGFTRNTRKVQTCVNLKGGSHRGPGQVLVIGGLTQTQKLQLVTETPILSRIPIIGWFFRGDREIVTETELGIFIRPTIVDPRRRTSMREYTTRKIRGGLRPVDESFMGNKKDPIVRFFFGLDSAESDIVEDYMRETRLVPAEDIAKAPPPSSRAEETLVPLETFDASLRRGKEASPQPSTQEMLELQQEAIAARD